MDIIENQTSPADVLSALKTLLTQMGEVHDRIFSRLDGIRPVRIRDQVKSLIAVVASARQPIGVKALEHAITISPGVAELDPLRVPNATSLVSRAFGLVVINEKTTHVRLAHETHAHYIHGAKTMPSGDRLLAEASMAYLQLDSVSHQDQEFDKLEQNRVAFPFLSYASSLWAIHVHPLQDEILDRVLHLLLNKAAATNMAQLMWQDDPDWDTTRSVHALHLAAYFGLASAVVKLAQTLPSVDVLDHQATTPLMYAAMKGQYDAAKALLAAGADPSRICARGRTALHRACQNTRVDVVQLLLECSSDVALRAVDQQFKPRTALSWSIRNRSQIIVNLLLKYGYAGGAEVSSDRSRENPMVLAAAVGRVEVVKELLSDGRIPVDSRDDQGNTALTVAARNGHKSIAVISLLLQYGADLEARNEAGATVLLSSLDGACPPVVQLLIKHGARLDVFDDRGRGLLFKCAYHNRPYSIHELLKRESDLDVNAQDKYGETPLHCAVDRGNMDCVVVLVRCGARTDIQASNGLAPCSMARAMNNSEMLRLLRSLYQPEDYNDEALLHNAVLSMDLSELTLYLDERSNQSLEMNALDFPDRQTALHVAARHDLHLKACLLLDRGARFDVFNRYGCQALHAAVAEDAINVADVNGLTQDGIQSPLEVVTVRQCQSMVFLLIRNGAAVDLSDPNVTWIMDAAAQAGELEVVRRVVEAGVSFTKTNEDGETPFQVARKHGHLQVAQYFFEQVQKEKVPRKLSRTSSPVSGTALLLTDADTVAGAQDLRPLEREDSDVGDDKIPSADIDDDDLLRYFFKWRHWAPTLIALVLAMIAWAFLRD